jgi:DNA polymerase-3 subunit epsilon
VSDDFFVAARRAAARQARQVLRRDFVIFDSETTGLDAANGRIVSIAVIDVDGRVLVDTLLNPGIHIPEEATEIHGITDQMVKDAPKFTEVYPAVRDALRGRVWVGYNLPFDASFLEWECRRNYCLIPAGCDWYDGPETACVMRMYADFYGEYNDYHGNFKWQKLGFACRTEGIRMGQAHFALDDALATLALLRRMSEYD